MLFLILASVVIGFIYLYFKQRYSLFARHGVKHHPPVPLLGNMARVVMQTEQSSQDTCRYYFDFPNERFVGKYEFMNPVVIIRDLELVKKITTKDFEHFFDHRIINDDQYDEIFAKNLFSLRGQTWKDMRSTLSPFFTSSKIRKMVPFMVEVGDQMNKALKKNIDDSGVGYIDVDIKDIAGRYANDVVASCVFGLKMNSHQDRDSQFYAMGKKLSSFSFRQLLVFLGYSSFPWITKTLGIAFLSKKLESFYRDLVTSIIQDREIKNIIRPDLIQQLMQVKKEQETFKSKEDKYVDTRFDTVELSSLTVGNKKVNRAWSDDYLTAQALLFFIAGFDTVSSTMSFLLHELALNPDIQKRLAQEIRENVAKNSGKFDYDSIQSMEYLDMVVSETVRRWPTGSILDRVCSKDYNCGKPNDKATEDFIIPKGTGISIPVWAFHQDPQFFPDPERFDPERFSEQNRHKITPFAYMPFGHGPRNCIGSRFALCEVKVMVCQLLHQVEVSPCEKTCIPSTLAKNTFLIQLKGGYWLRMKERA